LILADVKWYNNADYSTEGSIRMKLTIRKIAELANVSKSTVSRALNDNKEISQDTKDKILSIVQNYGYEPNFNARNLATKRTRTVGIVIPHSPKYLFRNPFLTNVLLGISEVLSQNGYNMFISFEKEFDYSVMVKNGKVDGIIFLMIRYHNKWIDQLAEGSIPFVCIGEHHLKEKVNYIDSYDTIGIFKAVEYLVKLGHRDIAYLGGNQEFCSGINRFKGYKQGMEYFSLELKDEWIISSSVNLEEDGRRIMEGLLQKRNLPSAIVAFNDLIAIGCMQVAKQRGMDIPKDISIIGFDNIHYCSVVSPTLTTINNLSYEKGLMAAEWLIDIVEGKENSKYKTPYLLPTELVERESCIRIGS